MPMATATKRWTLDELHRLPDDGNKYELVRGELFVTPPPTLGHETIAARLSLRLAPYVAAQGLGLVYHPRAVLRIAGSEVEPDLMVRQPPAHAGVKWDKAPLPILVVEIVSPYTRRRDQVQKRSLYMDAGVGEYWLVDPEQRTIVIVKAGEPDRIAREQLTWTPAGASSQLYIELAELFGDRAE